MTELCLMSLLLLGQNSDDAAQYGAGSGETSRQSYEQDQEYQFAPPRPLPRSANATPLGQQPATIGPNVGQQLTQSPYVSPATAEASSPESANGGLMSQRQPLPLTKQGQSPAASSASGRAPPSVGGTVVNIVSSLAVVLGLFFLVAWFLRKGAAKTGGVLPGEVVQVLGRSALSPRQQMQLLRVGEKLVLVAVTTAGVQTLTEVTDPQEVERLSAACEASRAGSASASFRETLSQLGNQPAVGGFFGSNESTNTARGRRNSSATGREEARA